MKQWEIWKFPYPDPESAHWCVILSADDICSNSDEINTLVCQTLRPVGRPLKSSEVILDHHDGMEQGISTVVRCHRVFTFKKQLASELPDGRGDASTSSRDIETVVRWHKALNAFMTNGEATEARLGAARSSLARFKKKEERFKSGMERGKRRSFSNRFLNLSS